MHSAYSQHGYTLLQMLVAVMVMSIMAAMGIIMYQYYVQQARVKAVQAALLENAHFLERFYGQRHSFKQDVNRWASLPIVQTEHFCIRLQGNPLNAESDRFMLNFLNCVPAPQIGLLRIATLEIGRIGEELMREHGGEMFQRHRRREVEDLRPTLELAKQFLDPAIDERDVVASALCQLVEHNMFAGMVDFLPDKGADFGL